MELRSILGRATEVMAFLFAAFGGILFNIAPVEDFGETVGFASFVTLIALLLVSALARRQQAGTASRFWLILASVSGGFFVVSFWFYLRSVDQLTFPYPPDIDVPKLYVRGTELTAAAEKKWNSEMSVTHRQAGGAQISQFVVGVGGIPARDGHIWTHDSFRSAKLAIMGNYVVLVLSLALSLFALIEITIIVNPPPASIDDFMMRVRKPKHRVSWSGSARAGQPFYDAFLSYRHLEPDSRFARSILTYLENDGYRVAIDVRDFRGQCDLFGGDGTMYPRKPICARGDFTQLLRKRKCAYRGDHYEGPRYG